MNSSFHAISERYTASCAAPPVDNCTTWQGSRRQFTTMTTGITLICFVIVLANLLNLLIFLSWRNKEPYIFFHISLAVTAVTGGVLASVTSISRILDWTLPVRLPIKISVAALILVQFSGSINIVFISLDRWLSVEWAVKYRATVTPRRIFFAIAVILCLGSVYTIPPVIIWRECIVITCNKTPSFRWNGQSYLRWNWVKGLPLLLTLFASQLRIVMVAAQAQLRRQRNQRNLISVLQRNPGAPSRVVHAQRVVRILWRNLLPGMAVAILAIISNLPYVMQEQLKKSGLEEDEADPKVMLTVYMSSIQHVFSPLIYVLFFQKYRRTLLRFCHCFRPSFLCLRNLTVSYRERTATSGTPHDV